MGFAQREQGSVNTNRFLGMYDTVTGPTAPQNTAEDAINIDFQNESIRGRPPSERVLSIAMGEHALFFDGKSRYATTTYTTTNFSLSTPTEFLVRAYVSQIDVYKMKNIQGSRKWCIVESAGDSTTLNTFLNGWGFYFDTGGGAPQLIARLHDGAQRELTINVRDLITSSDEAVSIEFSLLAGTYTIRFFIDGSNTHTAIQSLAFGAIGAAATHALNIGAFQVAATTERIQYLDGTIGNVEIWTGTDSIAAAEAVRWNSFNRTILPTLLDFLHQPDEGSGWQTTPLGNAGFTDSGAGRVDIHPLPPEYQDANDRIVFGRRHWGELDIRDISASGTRGWGMIFGFRVLELASPSDFSEPPWLIISSDDTLVVTVSAPGVSEFRVTAALGLFSLGAAITSLSITSADLALDTGYRVAIFYEYDFSANTTTARMFVLTSATPPWVVVTPTTNAGVAFPGEKGNIYQFGTDARRARFINHTMDDFRLFMGLTPPVTAANILALDVYGDNRDPSLIISLDASADTTIETESMVRPANVRAISWRDNLFGNHTMRFYPDGASSPWALMPFMTRGVKPQILGVHPSIENVGESQRRLQSIITNGGAYRYDVARATGRWIQSLAFNGFPTAGTRAIDNKERVIVSGQGMAPQKIYPNGMGLVGLPIPHVVPAFADNGANGDLVAATAYVYRFTIFNSKTGQESNATGESTHTTGGGVTAITITISEIFAHGTEDWDTIRVYRQENAADVLFYLEQEQPRPFGMPPYGPDIVIESKLLDTELVLNKLLEIDNDPPEDFSAAVIANRRMITMGGGPNPGWAYYSKFALIESFPPLNIWQLNDDDGDRGVAGYVINGKLLLLKQRTAWIAPEELADIGGIQPRQVQGGVGCTGTGASVLTQRGVFLVGSDGAIYHTDGLTFTDISSRSILATMRGFTAAQLKDAQAADDAKGDRVWFSIGTKVLVFNYETGRWSTWEMPIDSLGTGYDQFSEKHAVFGYRGNAYRLDHNAQTNQESDDGASHSTSFVVEYVGGSPGDLFDGPDGLVWRLVDSVQWDATVEGMPMIVVVHTTARNADPTSSAFFEPLFEGTRLSNHVAGVSGTSLYLGEGIVANDVTDRITIYVGSQYRKYLSQRMAPQGEGFPYLFSGMSLESSAAFAGSSSAAFRARFDDDTTYLIDYRRTLTGGVRDRSFSLRKSGRSIQWLLEQFERTDILEIQKAITRYRVRGPRRKAY